MEGKDVSLTCTVCAKRNIFRPEPDKLIYTAPMETKPKIVIMGSFPIWLLEKDIPTPKGHYAVWLMAMHEMLKSVSEYELHWICACKGISRAREIQHGNQMFHVLPVGSLEFASRTHYVWDRFRIRRILNRVKPDVVHAWGTENRWAVSACDFPGKKILSVQGALTAYHQRCPGSKFMQRQAAMEPRLLPQFDLITTESPWCKSRCSELSPLSKIVEWEYAVDDCFFHLQRVLSPEPTCLLAGSDSPLKNVDTAVAAFSHPSLSHVTLLLAGTDAERRPNLPTNIKALGRVSRQRMAELFSSAWVLVHPSLADTGPTIVKEARVSGAAVVLSTECGSAQYVESGKSGYIIAPRDVEALREAVLKTTADAETAERMGAWKQDECRRLLSKETMLNRLMEIYDAVLQGRIQDLS